MTARIVQLYAEQSATHSTHLAVPRRASAAGTACGEAPVRELAFRSHCWRGASGRAYVHTIFDLVACPPLPASNYVLVRCDENGRRRALSIGRVRHEAPSLNLAEIRQRAASLHANEVHVHFLASDAPRSLAVELDIKAIEQDADPATTATACSKTLT